MRSLRLLLALALVLAAVAPPVARAQWEEITVNTIKPAVTTRHQCIGPTSATCVRIETDGQLNPQVANADGYVFLAAPGNCVGDTTNLTPTRVAASDWALARTASAAAGEVINITCNLNSWLQRAGGTRGVKVTALKVYHQITVANLFAATWGKLATRGHANNTANTTSGADQATAPTLPTATQTNPYATTVAIASAKFLPAGTDTDLALEFSVELRNTSVYRLYGIGVSFSRI